MISFLVERGQVALERLYCFYWRCELEALCSSHTCAHGVYTWLGQDVLPRGGVVPVISVTAHVGGVLWSRLNGRGLPDDRRPCVWPILHFL